LCFEVQIRPARSSDLPKVKKVTKENIYTYRKARPRPGKKYRYARLGLVTSPRIKRSEKKHMYTYRKKPGYGQEKKKGEEGSEPSHRWVALCKNAIRRPTYYLRAKVLYKALLITYAKKEG
jgi:hypothetical protein